MSLLKFTNLTAAVLVIVVFGLTSAAQSVDKDVENLRKHLAEIRAITDEAHNPCDNFPKYACGNYHNASGGGNYPNDRVYFSEIADELNRLKEIKLQSTHKAKDFLESCMKHQNPKNILQKVEVFQNPTQFKLARTLGILKTSGINAILLSNINALDDKKVRINIKLDENLFLSNAFSERIVKRNLELMEVKPAERMDAEKKINAFIQKGKSILTSSREKAVVGSDLKALKNFDWDEYLNELKKMPKVSQATLEFVLEDVVNLQKIIDLVHETDLQALRLVTALEFMAEVIDTECDMVVDYFRLPLFAEFYRMYFTDSDRSFNLVVLKEFEKSHSEIKSKLENVGGGGLSRVQEKRKILESMNQILDGSKIDADYKDVLIEKDNFYQNYLYVARNKIQRYLSKASSKSDQSEDYLMNILNPVNRNKPVFYHFASQGLYLWELFFRESRPKYSYDQLRDCLDEQQDKYRLFEFNDLDYFEYVDAFAAMKQTYLDYKRYWDQEYDSAHKLDNIFKEFHLTNDQAFFLNLAQRECARVDNGKNIPFRILLNLEEASKVFSCPIGSQLNIEEKCTVW
ncbi:neprilysin-1-like [Eupeodes corollae]|uniref:neprilysin-1-like n=1 Tax=Eupeodes corollae TaxID=290404 RepID=UPI002493CFC6|nr:neprilysin-1-like [Eupeodes corollae]